MNHEIKRLPKSQVQIKVTVPSEKMEEYRKKATAEISKDVSVKGFRPGHVPPEVLKQHVDEKYIIAHAQELAIQNSYAEIVVSEKIQVVARPHVHIESDEPLTYTATVAVMPEVEVKDHKSIKVKLGESSVNEKDMEDVINDMRKYGTIYMDVEREAKKGDRLEIDFEGFDDEGKAVLNTKSQNHPVIIGENTLIPGFEEELVGLKKGEDKEFDITFPKDYGKKDFQNKKLKFKVKVNRVEEPSIPDFDDALIERVTGKKQSTEEFKKELTTNIQAKKEQEAKQKQENEYLEKLLAITKVELPDALIDEEVQFLLDDIKDEIGQKGLEFGKFLEQVKTTEDELRAKYRPEAEKRLKIRLALQYLIKAEAIEISEEEVNSELEKVKSFYPENQHSTIQDDFDKGQLSTQINNRLALRKLFDKVLG